jgi:mannose-1-phosphate guanylyltransferase
MTCSLEKFPLGTAGPIRLAKEHLVKGNESGLFFVFNSDIICKFPLQALIDHHRKHGKEGTICVTPVEDPSRYGVVQYNPDDFLISAFIEKPPKPIPNANKINAGIYLFNTSVIDRIPLNVKTSIERKIFPVMAAEKQICAFHLKGFWRDLGKPLDFIDGLGELMEYFETNDPDQLSKGENVIGNAMIVPFSCLSFRMNPRKCRKQLKSART